MKIKTPESILEYTSVALRTPSSEDTRSSPSHPALHRSHLPVAHHHIQLSITATSQ